MNPLLRLAIEGGPLLVFFLTNAEACITTVGLPYIILGFDNPDTPPPMDESDANSFGIDSNSIFRDIEFCQAGGGVYTLDAFGGVFAFGNTRPVDSDPSTGLSGGPYFFPNLYARDLEPQTETGTAPAN